MKFGRVKMRILQKNYQCHELFYINLSKKKLNCTNTLFIGDSLFHKGEVTNIDWWTRVQMLIVKKKKEELPMEVCSVKESRFVQFKKELLNK